MSTPIHAVLLIASYELADKYTLRIGPELVDTAAIWTKAQYSGVAGIILSAPRAAARRCCLSPSQPWLPADRDRVELASR